MPPRQPSIAHAKPVDTLIMDNVPFMAANIPINAGIVSETIHNPAVPQDEEASINNFNPLPNSVVSPINVDRLRAFLTNHPDTNLANFLIDGFCNGFSIGYNGPFTPGQCRNLLSARSQPAAVSSAIAKEVNGGHTAGPFESSPFASLHFTVPHWELYRKKMVLIA